MSMHYTMARNRPPRDTFVVHCKRCKRHIPAGVEAWTDQPIAVNCPLCGELRRYRPNEVYLDTVDPLLSRKEPQQERPKHLQHRRRS